MRRRLGAALGAAAALVLVTSGTHSTAVRAQTPPPHRAAVIIDTGSAVKHVCILFSADSISGKDALDLANQVDPSVQPVYRDYGSLGAAVCSLCGTGNPQNDCLGNQSAKYWAYDRAPNGTAKFSQSSEGISSSQVHDGDVEGWFWGQGGAPPYASVEQVCGTISTDGTFTPTSVSSSGGSPQPLAGSTAARIPERRPPQGTLAPTSTAPSSTTTTSTTAPGEGGGLVLGSGSGGPSGTALARLPKKGGGPSGGGSLVGLVGFGAVAAGLGGWFWWLRHARTIKG